MKMRYAITIVPTLMIAASLGLTAWVQWPQTERVRWFFGFYAVYVIWLWCDWMVRVTSRPRP